MHAFIELQSQQKPISREIIEHTAEDSCFEYHNSDFFIISFAHKITL